MPLLTQFFDKIFVISLADRDDRLGLFYQEMYAEIPEWQDRIALWPAVDGRKVPHPGWYTAGDGAWGCLRSHLGIIERGLQEGWRNVLIFEDDCQPLPGFRTTLEAALEELPADWDYLYPGGQFIREDAGGQSRYSDHLLSAWNINRTHAYAVNRREMGEMYRHLNRTDWGRSNHIDHQLGIRHEYGGTKVYAVCSSDGTPWICAQRGGRSDITGRDKPQETWKNARIFNTMLYKGIEIKYHDVGFGQLGLNGALGYEGKQVQIANTSGWHTLSAHANSRVVVYLPGPIELYAAQNGDGNAVARLTAKVDGVELGTLQAAQSTTNTITLPAGEHTLTIEGENNRNGMAHSVWVFKEIETPVLEILTNTACPRSCPHCNQGAFMAANPGWEYTPDHARALVTALDNHPDRKIRVAFTGGEVGLWKHAKEVMEIFRACPQIVGNWAVTSLITEENLLAMKALYDRVCCSIRPDTFPLVETAGSTPEWLAGCTLWDQREHTVPPSEPVEGPVVCCCAQQGIAAAIIGERVFPCIVAESMRMEGRWPYLISESLDEFFGDSSLFKGSIGHYDACRMCVNNMTVRKVGRHESTGGVACGPRPSKQRKKSGKA